MDERFYDKILNKMLNDVYTKSVFKWRVEPMGSSIIITHHPRINLFFLNPKATIVFQLIDGSVSVGQIVNLTRGNMNQDLKRDIIKTIRFLESNGAIKKTQRKEVINDSQ